jgi:hypothetical protein
VSVRHPTELVCRDVVERVTDLLSNALEAEARARIEQHLLVCPPCTIYLGQVRATIDLCGELRDRAPGQTEVPPALREAFRRARGGKGA